MNDSQATRPDGSYFRTASSTASEIWSQTLSGCPSVTDSDVNTYRLAMLSSFYLSRSESNCMTDPSYTDTLSDTRAPVPMMQ